MSRLLRLFAVLALGSSAMLAITAAILLAPGSSDPARAQAIGGPVFVSGDDAEDHCDGTNCGGLMAAVLKNSIDLSLSPGTGIAAIGMEDPDNTDALDSWNEAGNGGPNVPITVIPLAEIPTVDFADFAVIFIPSNETDGDDPVGIDNTELVALNARQADIVDFVNNLGGGLIALTEQDADTSLAFGYLPLPLEFANVDYQEAVPTAALAALAPNATTANMAHDNWHNVWTGPPGYGGLNVLATSVIPDDQLDGFPALLGGERVILSGLITPTPEAATNTPTPTVAAETATPTPAVAEVVELPTSGGPPSDGGTSTLPWLAAIAGAIALIGSGSAWFSYRRRPTR